MHKGVRNTIFTVAAIGLTSFGIHWNKSIALKHQPLSVQQIAQAANSNHDETVPVSILAEEPIVVLGHQQYIAIQTLANANLTIITKLPNGSADVSHTLQAQADHAGRYVMSYDVSDFHALGETQITVVSSVGGKSNEATTQYQVQAPQPSSSSGSTFSFN